VDVDPAFSGKIQNHAVIDHENIPRPITVTAEAMITDQPLLAVEKSVYPPVPGANQPMTYTLLVTNYGQPAVNLAVTLTDEVPAGTEFRSVGSDGSYSQSDDTVTWARSIDLGVGATTAFTFSVDVMDVPSGTVVTNQSYQVEGPAGVITAGLPHTITVIDPILSLYKETDPDPPGANREMTYTLTLLNKGSLAKDLVVTDRVPDGASYVSGGSFANGVVTWMVPHLDTDEIVHLSYVVDLPDAMDFSLVNDEFEVCTGAGLCEPGVALTSLVQGPHFDISAWVFPIAKKPGGGTGPVTPTLVVHNTGPGSAVDASVLLEFRRISVGEQNDLVADPPSGTFSEGPDCGDKCNAYRWIGPIDAGASITFTTSEGQSTIGGEEGTHYTATLVISDTLGDQATEPVTGTAIGTITHFANLIPTKSAPAIIGQGQTMTYTFTVWNSGLSTDEPSFSTLTDTVPMSVSVESVSDGGSVQSQAGGEIVTWGLPEMSTGERLRRYYTVRVPEDILSGTLIVNDAYGASWFEDGETTPRTTHGSPVTTTVVETGLIDSFKVVTPTHALPGPGTILTFTLHVVNSGPTALDGVEVYDVLPWQHSTYQRDAIASAGEVISDIVSVAWTGDLAPFSTETVTMSVLVDPDYEGPITNTATIDHSSRDEPVTVTAVAYITDEPVLEISKTASPDPVKRGEELAYTLRVVNLGKQATDLTVFDQIPENGTLMPGSVTAGGQVVNEEIHWAFPVLQPGDSKTLRFRVRVNGGSFIINDVYRVDSAEGAFDIGHPIVTPVTGGGRVLLPVLLR
jgi:uncharacterized repeat protein (TIGR01451 family)